jgi:hypothetical protein
MKIEEWKGKEGRGGKGRGIYLSNSCNPVPFGSSMKYCNGT